MNDILKKLQKEIVDTKIGKIKQSVKGFITTVYYQERLCDVVYFDNTGAKRKVKRLKLPEDGNGIFNQSPKPGDRVELSFRNQNNNVVYITRVYRRDENKHHFKTEKGQFLPNSTGLF